MTTPLHEITPRHTTPGGYPIFILITGLLGDDEPHCYDCAEQDWVDLSKSTFQVHINWESELYCEECGGDIEAAIDIASERFYTERDEEERAGDEGSGLPVE